MQKYYFAMKSLFWKCGIGIDWWNIRAQSRVSSYNFHCFRDAQLFQWCQYSFGKLGHWIIKLCIESLNTLKINTIFATRIPCLLSTLLRNGDMWIYSPIKINSIWLKFPGLCKIQMQICNSCYCSLNLY